jgi:hypothetical protein
MVDGELSVKCEVWSVEEMVEWWNGGILEGWVLSNCEF